MQDWQKGHMTKIIEGRKLSMKWISRVLLLLLYSVPYAFLAIYGDAQWGSLWLYLPMIVGFTVLAIIAHVTKNEVIVLVGNVLSVISSYTQSETESVC